MKDKGKSMTYLSWLIQEKVDMDNETKAIKYDITSIKARLHHIEEQLEKPKPRKSNVVYMGKPIDDMTRDELIDSLEATCTYISSFNCILKDTM